MLELTTNITNGNRINDEKSLHKPNANTLSRGQPKIVVDTLHHTPNTYTLSLWTCFLLCIFICLLVRATKNISKKWVYTYIACNMCMFHKMHNKRKRKIKNDIPFRRFIIGLRMIHTYILCKTI